MDRSGSYFDGVEQHPLAVWSVHAADLARDVQDQLQCWPDTPTTRSLVADGLLTPVRPGVYLPGGHRLSMPDRAVAIGCALGPELRGHHVIAGTSAAWVLLGGSLPRPLDLLTTSRPHRIAGVRVRQGTVDRVGVESIGGAPITVPARTAVDLLRFTPEHRAVQLVAALVDSGHCREREVEDRIAALDAHPYARRARDLWHGLLRKGRARAAA